MSRLVVAACFDYFIYFLKGEWKQASSEDVRTHTEFNSFTGLVTLFPSPVYSLDAPLSRLVALGMEMEVACHDLFIYFLKGEWKQASSEEFAWSFCRQPVTERIR